MAVGIEVDGAGDVREGDGAIFASSIALVADIGTQQPAAAVASGGAVLQIGRK
jgi:hypothetical protein